MVLSSISHSVLHCDFPFYSSVAMFQMIPSLDIRLVQAHELGEPRQIRNVAHVLKRKKIGERKPIGTRRGVIVVTTAQLLAAPS
jgi:hypothetical protein